MHPANKYVRAEEIMSGNVVHLNLVSSVESIHRVLETSHHGFPVVNNAGRVVGLIPKNYLIILVNKKAFYGSSAGKIGFDSAGTILNKANSIKPLLGPVNDDHLGKDSSGKQTDLDKTHSEDDHAKPFILSSVLDHDLFPVDKES